MSNAAIADYVDSELGPIQSNGDNPRFALEEPIQLKGFSATYDRKFNLGNFESLNPAITVWVKTNVPEGTAFDLDDCKKRLRQMAATTCAPSCSGCKGTTKSCF